MYCVICIFWSLLHLCKRRPWQLCSRRIRAVLEHTMHCAARSIHALLPPQLPSSAKLPPQRRSKQTANHQTQLEKSCEATRHNAVLFPHPQLVWPPHLSAPLQRVAAHVQARDPPHLRNSIKLSFRIGRSHSRHRAAGHQRPPGPIPQVNLDLYSLCYLPVLKVAFRTLVATEGYSAVCGRSGCSHAGFGAFGLSVTLDGRCSR